MRSLTLVLALLAVGTLSARSNCDINVNYVENRDGSTTLHITHSKDCKMSISLTEAGGDIQFKSTKKSSRRASCQSQITQSAPKEKVIIEKSFKNLPREKLIEKIIATAKSRVGSRYKPGATGPNSFDCSGFVYYTFKKHGIKLPRVSTRQAEIGRKLARKELKKGDIVCFDTSKRGHVNHTGIYLGDGRFIHASSGRAYSVTVSNLDKGFYKEKFRWGVRAVK